MEPPGRPSASPAAIQINCSLRACRFPRNAQRSYARLSELYAERYAELYAAHTTRRILIPQRQTIIARARVAMTNVLSQWALIGWPSVSKTVGDSRNTQHLNFKASTEEKNETCFVLKQVISQR